MRAEIPLMTLHFPDLGSASDWLNQISQAARPIHKLTMHLQQLKGMQSSKRGM